MFDERERDSESSGGVDLSQGGEGRAETALVQLVPYFRSGVIVT